MKKYNQAIHDMLNFVLHMERNSFEKSACLRMRIFLTELDLQTNLDNASQD